MKSLILSLIFLFLFNAPSNAQYKMLWEKQIQATDIDENPENITGISPLDGGYLIMFKLNIDWVNSFPAFAYIDKSDHLYSSQYIDIDSFANVEMLGAARRSETQISVMGNDYTDRHDGKPIPMPFEIILTRSSSDSTFGLYSGKLTNVTSLNGDKTFAVSGNISNGSNGHFMTIIKKDVNNKPRCFLYNLGNGGKTGNAQFENADNATLWYGDAKSIVMSTETPFGNGRHFYQLRVLDKDYKIIKTYPHEDHAKVLSLIGPNSTDRLVRVTYKPSYDLGFASRQVKTETGQNILSWYTFNGLDYPNPVFTKVGIDGDVQTTVGPVLPENEEVIMDGDLNNGRTNMNIMVASVDRHHDNRVPDDLVLSVVDYYGLETTRQTIKGYVDGEYGIVKAWMNDDNQIYVVANTPRSITDTMSGLYISKWVATQEALENTFHRIKDARKWSADPFFSKVRIEENDKATYTILGIDNSDPLFPSSADLVGREIKLQDGGLQPILNSYWFSGTVKVGKKKYVFERVAVVKK